MTTYIPIPLMIVYCLYTFFSYYQHLHFRNFRGASRRFWIALMYFNIAAMLFQVGFLILYGVTVVWWAPLVLVGIGMLSFIPLSFVEDLFSAPILSLLGFIMVPVCGGMMIYFLPDVR